MIFLFFIYSSRFLKFSYGADRILNVLPVQCSRLAGLRRAGLAFHILHWKERSSEK